MEIETLSMASHCDCLCLPCTNSSNVSEATPTLASLRALQLYPASVSLAMTLLMVSVLHTVAKARRGVVMLWSLRVTLESVVEFNSCPCLNHWMVGGGTPVPVHWNVTGNVTLTT